MANPKLLSNLITPENDSLAIKDAYKTGIYTVIGTQTAATGSWTGALHGVPALYTGLTIMYYLPWAGSGNATLNLTLDDGTTTGPINCYYSTSRLTTHYGKGCNIVMTYYKAGDISIDGAATTVDHWIANANYDTNTTTENRIAYFAGKTGVRGIWATSLFMEDANGTYQNISMGFDATATSLGTRTVNKTKIPNSNGFRIGSPIWYTNTTYASNTNISGSSVVYSSISIFDSRYTFNTELVAGSLTPYKKLYLVGTINPEDNLFYLDNPWWTQTPNDPHKVYVLVGSCFDSTTSYCRITLYEQNKWYRYDGTNLVEFTYGATTLVSKASMTPVIDTAPYLFRQSGGDNNAFVGTEETDKLVGASAVVNQLVDNSKFINPTTSDYTVVNNGDGSLAVTIINTLASAINVLLTANATPSYVKIPRSHKYILLDNNILPTGVIYRNGYNGATIGVNVIKAQPDSLDYFLLSVILPIGLTAQTFTLKPNIIDLTAMFGTTIADYVYSLEQATAGSGIAYLRKYGFFTKDYIPYTANALQSVNTSKHSMVGFNQFDKTQVVVGERWKAIGTGTAPGTTRSLPLRCLPNTTYYFLNVCGINAMTSIYWLREDKTVIYYEGLIGNSPQSGAKTSPSDAYYIGINFRTIDIDDVCVNISSSKNGTYEPYSKHEYTLPNIDLRGLYKLDASNNLYADGDTLEGDGTLTRKFFVHTFTGEENIVVAAQYYIKSDACDGFVVFNDMPNSWTADTPNKAICNKLSQATTSIWITEGYPNTFTLNTNQVHLNIANSLLGITDYTQETTTTAKAKIKAFLASQYANGTPYIVVLPLATPTTETATGFTNPQAVDKFGTEEYTDERDFPLPVGHSTNYISAVYGDREKLDSLPDRTLTDGMYAIAEAGGKMSLVPTSEISVGDAETVNGHTVATDVPSGAVFTDTTYTFADGTNGFTVTPAGGTAQTVTVTPNITNNITGSGTTNKIAKFTGANTIGDGYSVDTTVTGESENLVTSGAVWTAIDNLPEPMVFQGSVGTDGTKTWANLPAPSATGSTKNIGHTYKAIEARTTSQTSTLTADVKIGDTIISDGTNWVVIPSGDEPSGTVTSVTLQATSPIVVDNSSAITTSGTRTFSHADSGVTAGTYKSVTVDAKGHVTAGTNPTTLSGYGITDAKIANGTVTLGSNSITPLTSSSTLDASKLSGTVPSTCYTDTKNTAGSTDTSSKIYLVGATSQGTNPQTYSDDEVYATSGVVTTKSVQIGGGSCTLQYNSTTQSCDFIFS